MLCALELTVEFESLATEVLLKIFGETLEREVFQETRRNCIVQIRVSRCHALVDKLAELTKLSLGIVLVSVSNEMAALSEHAP